MVLEVWGFAVRDFGDWGLGLQVFRCFMSQDERLRSFGIRASLRLSGLGLRV